MTDKVSAEVPSSYSGTIKELIVPEGETVKVGTLLAYIETESDDTSDEDETSEKIDKSENEQKKQNVDNNDSMAARYSPAVLKLSQEHGINLQEVTGTGLGGRITRKDIYSIIEDRKSTRLNSSHVSIS